MTISVKRAAIGAGIAALLVGGATAAQGQSAAGHYTEAQAQRGVAAYAETCSLCHGADMRGGPGSPSLAGPEFMFTWKTKSAGELFDYVKTNMPPGAGGSLSDQQYADVVAAVLKANAVPAGQAELPADAAALKSLSIAGK
jgi:mono/diheme cytochrome c family protein